MGSPRNSEIEAGNRGGGRDGTRSGADSRRAGGDVHAWLRAHVRWREASSNGARAGRIWPAGTPPRKEAWLSGLLPTPAVALPPPRSLPLPVCSPSPSPSASSPSSCPSSHSLLSPVFRLLCLTRFPSLSLSPPPGPSAGASLPDVAATAPFPRDGEHWRPARGHKQRRCSVSRFSRTHPPPFRRRLTVRCYRVRRCFPRDSCFVFNIWKSKI